MGKTVPVNVLADRAALLKALASMPEESFGWFVAWATGAMIQYPDGRGGFRQESRDAIDKLHAEGKAYMEKQG